MTTRYEISSQTGRKEGRMEDGFNSHVVLLVVPPRFMTDLCLISTILTTLDKDPFIATRSCRDYPRPLTPHPSSLCKHRAKYIQRKELSLGITCRAFHAWLNPLVFQELPRHHHVTKLSRHVSRDLNHFTDDSCFLRSILQTTTVLCKNHVTCSCTTPDELEWSPAWGCVTTVIIIIIINAPMKMMEFRRQKSS